MAKIGLFFDTDTGNTRKVAKQIRKRFNDDEIDLINVAKASSADFESYSALILGTPTLGDGELPERWAELLPALADIEWGGKTVALFGLGDQEGYPDEFVDALGIIYEALSDSGATLIGGGSTEGYEYSASRAEVDGQFIGLVLDLDNQKELTDERIDAWFAEVAEPLRAAAAATPG